MGTGDGGGRGKGGAGLGLGLGARNCVPILRVLVDGFGNLEVRGGRRSGGDEMR